MKRFLIICALLICGAGLRAQDAKVASGHSISASIVGFEYGYEHAMGENWSMVFRAGLPPVLSSYIRYTDSNGQANVTAQFNAMPALTVEPRLYTTLNRRERLGKSTVNNSSDFLSLRTIVYTSDFGSYYITAIPMYGFRRGSEHWFREYTLGAAFHTIKPGFLPHFNFRIGYSF